MHEIYLSYEKVLNLKDDTFERGVISTFYNGKELQDGKRLDWYDYGARFYDPALARFHIVDPMSEEPYNIVLTPYHYCNNNPILFIDINGEDWYVNDTTGSLHWYNGKYDDDDIPEGYSYLGTDDYFDDGSADYLMDFINMQTQWDDEKGEFVTVDKFDLNTEESLKFADKYGYKLAPAEVLSIEYNDWYVDYVEAFTPGPVSINSSFKYEYWEQLTYQPTNTKWVWTNSYADDKVIIIRENRRHGEVRIGPVHHVPKYKGQALSILGNISKRYFGKIYEINHGKGECRYPYPRKKNPQNILF